MKSRLLPRRELEALSEAKTLPAVIAILATTAYSKPVEAALARTSGMQAVTEALRTDLINTLGKIRRFYSDESGDMVALILRSYDIHNLKAVLRGLARQASEIEILNTVLPVGELDYNLLAELASTPGPRVAIDRLASMNHPIVYPLMRLRSEHPGADIPEMELVLDQGYYQQALKYIKEENLGGSFLETAIKLLADIANLLTVLRFARAPSERALIRQQYSTKTTRGLLVGPGYLTFDLLQRAAEQDSVDKAISVLASTHYADLLQTGLKSYSLTRRLSDFERHFARYRLKWMSGLIAKDPLGIGVVLGYLALKINEVNNIRWIVQGIQQGLETQVIRAEVEYAR
jgi:vacuolar-type H+-ATPase subunit C/Vma6